MGKKKTNKKARRQNPANMTSKTVIEKDRESILEDSFDFGGLPKRDLKKNLGCG